MTLGNIFNRKKRQASPTPPISNDALPFIADTPLSRFDSLQSETGFDVSDWGIPTELMELERKEYPVLSLAALCGFGGDRPANEVDETEIQQSFPDLQFQTQFDEETDQFLGHSEPAEALAHFNDSSWAPDLEEHGEDNILWGWRVPVSPRAEGPSRYSSDLEEPTQENVEILSLLGDTDRRSPPPSPCNSDEIPCPRCSGTGREFQGWGDEALVCVHCGGSGLCSPGDTPSQPSTPLPLGWRSFFARFSSSGTNSSRGGFRTADGAGEDLETGEIGARHA